jgi:hypothetical protein
VGLLELNVAVFFFLVNFVWEMWQIGSFAEIPSNPYRVGMLVCTQVTFGDTAISLDDLVCLVPTDMTCNL